MIKSCLIFFLKLTLSVIWAGLLMNHGYAQTDTIPVTDTMHHTDSAVAAGPKKKYEGIRFLRVGTDLKAAVMPFLGPGRMFGELALDYKFRDKIYLASELGWGSGHYDYSHLNYSLNAVYFKLGADNALLDLRYRRDFDMAYIGGRAGIGIGNRSEAHYTFESPFGGRFEGSTPEENFVAVWGEINAGMRLEVFNNIFLGWTGRAKFLFNKNTFNSIKPFYLPGYGNADNATAFDASFYISYILFKK